MLIVARQGHSGHLCRMVSLFALNAPVNTVVWECFVIDSSQLQVHLSFVRSVQMDSWTEKEIKAMQVGGNKQMNSFLSSHGVSRKSPIKKKYSSSAAALYREMFSSLPFLTCSIQAKIEGREPPTSLPENVVSSDSDSE